METTRPTAYGYDGYGYSIGDRVELHPGTDMWMRGARYGVVVGLSLTPNDRVRVRLDVTGRVYSGSADTFRVVPVVSACRDCKQELATDSREQS